MGVGEVGGRGWRGRGKGKKEKERRGRKGRVGDWGGGDRQTDGQKDRQTVNQT